MRHSPGLKTRPTYTDAALAGSQDPAYVPKLFILRWAPASPHVSSVEEKSETSVEDSMRNRLDRYAARCVNFVLVVTRIAVLGVRSAQKDTGNQPRALLGYQGRSLAEPLVGSTRLKCVPLRVAVQLMLIPPFFTGL